MENQRGEYLLTYASQKNTCMVFRKPDAQKTLYNRIYEPKTLDSTSAVDTMKSTKINTKSMKNTQNLHKEFVRLGREKNRITYKLLALLPKIAELKIYEQQGYSNIYDYAGKIAGLSAGVVTKALKLEKKLTDLPHLKEKIETQGINKVAIIAGLATKENERELAEKVEHMSKPALQEYSKELRGHVTAKWQVELDEKMMFMFLKLKKRLGKNLSNKECLRKILEKMEEKPKTAIKIPGEKVHLQKRDLSSKAAQQPILAKPTAQQSVPQKQNQPKRTTRYIPANKRKTVSEQCAHPGCYRPADVIHHPDRFSRYHSHENIKPLCTQHHEFAHNGITEPMSGADYDYRKCRQVALRA